MARTTNPTPGTAPSQTVESLDNAHLELGYLLDRLQQSLLHPDPAQERRLLTDEYERIRLTSVRLRSCIAHPFSCCNTDANEVIASRHRT